MNAAPGTAGNDGAGLAGSGPLAAARAGGIQCLAALVTLALAAAAVAAGAELASPWPWALLHGLVATILATVAEESGTRRLMHAGFLPAALAGAALPVPGGVWLAAAAVLALTSHNALRERVPLFLSSAAACSRLLECLPCDRPVRFVDAGCGTGGVLIEVARERPTIQCLGLETAWLPWLIARVRCGLSPNGARAVRRDLWQHPLDGVDVLYVYLSPVPMARLWAKACAEMVPGSVVVSNSFEIPGVRPESSLPVDDLTASVLHVYRVPARVH